MANIGKIVPQPANKKAIIGYSILTLIFFGIGILCFILLLGTEVGSPPETVGSIIASFLDDAMVYLLGVGATIAQYWWVVLLIVVGLSVLGFLVGWLLLYLVKKMGHILVYAGVAIYIVGAVVGAIFGMLSVGPFAFLGLIPVVFLVIGLFTNINKFKRAGEFMKFTGSVVLAEKGMIIAPLFVTLTSVLTFLSMASIFAYIAVIFQDSIEWLGYVLGSLASLLQLMIYYGMFYVAEAINTTYAYEWYRKRDPDMKFCIKNVAGMFGPIFAFGIATAVVSWLQRMLRSAAASSQQKGNIAGIILAILARVVASLLGIIFKYLTYFTLPAIAVEGRGFKDGVSRSFDLLKRYYMDVLIRETGVSRAMSIVQWIAFFIYGSIGAIIGVAWQLAEGVGWALAILLPVGLMLIFANIPTFFIFRPMKTAYLTFIFAYAQDEEKGHSLPTRMPAELRDGIRDAEKSLDPNKSIAKLGM